MGGSDGTEQCRGGEGEDELLHIELDGFLH
jgi:hypothetical protein